MVITNPDGDIVTTASGAGLGLVSETVATSTALTWNDKIEIRTSVANASGEMTYMDNGKYTVTVYSITEINAKKVKYATKKSTFTLSHTTPSVTFTGLRDVSTEYDYENINKSVVKDIVLDLFKFNLNGYSWGFNEDMIADVTYKLSDNYVLIQTVKFAVPLDGYTTDEFDYVTVSNINKSIKLGVTEE